MAGGGSDGSIIIDTQLDNSGFDKGSKKLESTISNIISSVNKIGKTVADSVYKTIPDTARAMQGVGASAKQTATQVEGAFDKALSRSAASIKKLEGSLAKAKAGLSEYDREAASIRKSTDEMLKAANTPGQVSNVLDIEKAQMEALNAKYATQLASVQQITAELEAQRNVHANLEAQQQAAQSAAAVSQGGGAAPDPNAVSGWQRFGAVLRQAASGAWETAKSIARIPLNAVAAGFKKAVNGMKQFHRQSKQTSSITGNLVRELTRLKSMLVSRIKRMFISSIFQSVQENMKLLGQFSSEFNSAMSNIKNSMKGLSANLSVSLGGLVTALEPVVTKVINAISRIISYINALFALLGGKSTVTVAKKQTDNYAKSLGGAAGAAEELKKQVYGFDKLNKRSSDSGGGGGGGGASPDDLYEEVPIDSLLPASVKNWFDQIKAAFEAGDWYGIGETIASGLNVGMQVVDDWINGTLRPLGVKWAANIANTLNGLVDGFEWKKLGHIIGDGLNAAFATLDTFLTTFNFRAFAAGLVDVLNGFIQRTDWGLIGRTIADAFTSILEFAYGAITNFNWGGLLTSIINVLRGFASTIAQYVSNIWTTIKTSFQNMDWKQLGSDVAAYIQNIDWTGIYWNVVDSALSIGKGIIDGICEGVKAALTGFVDFLSGLFADPIARVGADMDPELKACGADIVGGILVGIFEAAAKIGVWIWNNICDPIIQAVKRGLGINSPSTVMQGFGRNIVEGLLLGIKNAWSSITSFLTNALNAMKSLFSNAWSNIKSTASNAWNGIKTAISDRFTAAHNSVTPTINSMKSSLSSSWDSIKGTATRTWDTIKSSVSSSWESMRSTVSSKVSSLKSTVSNAWDGIKSSTSSAWSNISSTVTSKWNSLKSSLASTDWSSIGSNLCSGISRGINAGWSWLSSTVSNLARNMLNKAKSVLGIHSPSRVFEDEVGKNIGLGMAQGISDTEKDVLKTVSNLAQSTVDNFDTSPLKVDLAGNTMIDGLDAVADRLTSIASTFRSITSMLTTMGGLAAPQIAMGTVVPAKTRVEADGSSVSVEGFDVFANDFNEYMADIRAMQRKILNAVLNMRLVVDADSLERGITRAQKSRRLSFGGV